RDLRDGGYSAAVLCRLDQSGRARHIVIEDVMVDDLIMPPQFAGSGVQREHGIGVQVGPLPVAAPPTIRRIAGREKYQAASRVDMDQTPQARPRTFLPTVRSP